MLYGTLRSATSNLRHPGRRRGPPTVSPRLDTILSPLSSEMRKSLTSSLFLYGANHCRRRCFGLSKKDIGDLIPLIMVLNVRGNYSLNLRVRTSNPLTVLVLSFFSAPGSAVNPCELGAYASIPSPLGPRPTTNVIEIRGICRGAPQHPTLSKPLPCRMLQLESMIVDKATGHCRHCRTRERTATADGPQHPS